MPAPEAPFGEYLRGLVELSRNPVFIKYVRIEVVFGSSSSRVQEIPEVARRDGVASRPEHRLPSLPCHVQTSAKQLMDVGDFKGQVVEAEFFRPCHPDSAERDCGGLEDAPPLRK